MDGLQVVRASQEKQAVIIRQTDEYKNSEVYTYPEFVNDQPRRPDSQAPAPTPSEPYNQPLTRPRSRLPCGLSVTAYTILVVAVTLAICAAGFGGGIGAVAASKDKSCSTSNNDIPVGAQSQEATTSTKTTTITTTATSSTATATSTSSPVIGLVNDYTPLLPSSVNTTALNCTTGTSIYSASGSQFQLNCNTNYPNNDMVLIVAYTLDACIEACANMNTIQAQTVCHGIMFNANLELMVLWGNGNCWLKSAMQNPQADGMPPSVGAALVSSP